MFFFLRLKQLISPILSFKNITCPYNPLISSLILFPLSLFSPCPDFEHPYPLILSNFCPPTIGNFLLIYSSFPNLFHYDPKKPNKHSHYYWMGSAHITHDQKREVVCTHVCVHACSWVFCFQIKLDIKSWFYYSLISKNITAFFYVSIANIQKISYLVNQLKFYS